ncbi:outer membrane protein [Helicobacter cetorum]|uniref:outer membrane protein n=1 Tax=Helicobacter cetorum TaxID=138563 RepID=UPI000CF03139|nr:outer membrane beta-barrel protein [Helicobacter cetorum]
MLSHLKLNDSNKNKQKVNTNKDFNYLKVFVNKANLLNNALEKPLMDSYLNELNNIASETHSQDAMNSLKSIAEQFQSINTLINNQANPGGCAWNSGYTAQVANSTDNLSTGCNQTLAINIISSDLKTKLETLQNTLTEDLKNLPLANATNNDAKNSYTQILETMKNQVDGILNANTLSNLMVYLSGIANASNASASQMTIQDPSTINNQITNAASVSSGAKIAATEQDAVNQTLKAIEKFQTNNPNYTFEGNTTLQNLFNSQNQGSIYYQLNNQATLQSETIKNAYTTINTSYTSANGLQSILDNNNLIYSINQAITANTLKQLGITNQTNFKEYANFVVNELQQASQGSTTITIADLTNNINNMVRLVQVMMNSDGSGILKNYTQSLQGFITDLNNAQSNLNNASMSKTINNILSTISNQTSSVQVFSQNLSQLLASDKTTDLSQLKSFIQEINQKMESLESSIQSHTETRAFYQYNAGVSKQQGIANGVGFSIGYKQFFGQQRFFGLRYYGFFDYNHASIGGTANQVTTNIYTYGVGTDLLYNFFRKTFVSKAINVGVFGGIQIAGNTWESSLNNQIKSQWSSKAINPTNFQFLFNLGFRTNFASLVSQKFGSKGFFTGRTIQQGVEFGVKIPTINQQYFKSQGANLEYRRLYSFYVNYVVGF